MIGYGDFVTQIVNFVILAFVIFLIVKAANKAFAKPEEPAAPPRPRGRAKWNCSPKSAMR
jgi:large conductance mechanosensitive channel